MNLRIFDSVEELTRAAARTILQRQPARIGLSGGSTPKPLYELLAPRLGELPEGVTWVLVDERYVPHDDPQSNAAMIERTLFAQGMPERHRFVRVQTEGSDPDASARAFEQELPAEPLDVAILGCGDDGHTASLFPGTPVLDVADRRAASVYVPRLEQWRVTLTLPALRAAALRLVLAAGASKAPVLAQLREGADLPAARATRGLESWWLVDRDAVK